MKNFKQQCILSFDTFRFLLSLCVVFGHCYVILYRVNNVSVIELHNIAVDGFFILSGFLLGKSIDKLTKTDTNEIYNIFLQLNIRRFKRLWFEYLFAVCLWIIFLFIKNCQVNLYPIPFNLLLLGGVNKIPNIVGGAWYVTVVFYVGAILSYLLITKEKKSIYFLIPLIILFCFGYIYPVKGNLILFGENQYMFGAFPMAWLKGFMNMGIGIECFYVSQYLLKHPIPIKSHYKNNITLLIECLGIFLIVYAMTRVGAGKYDFLVLFGYPIIICLLYLKKEKILKFLSYNIWKKITPIAYMLYLTHGILLYAIKSHIDYKEYSEVIVYLSVMIISCTFAFICYHAQKWLFAKLKQLLFVPAVQNNEGVN